jgi:hypothetical protein
MDSIKSKETKLEICLQKVTQSAAGILILICQTIRSVVKLIQG